MPVGLRYSEARTDPWRRRVSTLHPLQKSKQEKLNARQYRREASPLTMTQPDPPTLASDGLPARLTGQWVQGKNYYPQFTNYSKGTRWKPRQERVCEAWACI